ncbi:hypothetical protein [Bradyrhizobium elkanii]|uniref:Uncharacterized protein n=1 Tax=Bradyrhizobium elkanii TaxID=29448 RepID=A0A8I1YHR7_BRAEL|nr:hypothetical protein [Bradyrhizobium elkanii]MBP1296628.1 hypothetical protein [Bradyrhizobium elkanii]
MSERDKVREGAFEGTHTAAAGGAAASPGAVPAVIEGDDERLDGLLPLGTSPLAPRGRGRPAGAKNRRTDLVAQYLVDRFGDPLTASMSIAGRPLREVITELRMIASDCGLKLGATVMDVARWQQQCRVDALPYIHAKRAPETAKGDPVLPVLGIGRADQVNVVVAGGSRSLEEAVEISQQHQSVTTIDGEVSHDEMSHDGESDDASTT